MKLNSWLEITILGTACVNVPYLKVINAVAGVIRLSSGAPLPS